MRARLGALNLRPFYTLLGMIALFVAGRAVWEWSMPGSAPWLRTAAEAVIPDHRLSDLPHFYGWLTWTALWSCLLLYGLRLSFPTLNRWRQTSFFLLSFVVLGQALFFLVWLGWGKPGWWQEDGLVEDVTVLLFLGTFASALWGLRHAGGRRQALGLLVLLLVSLLMAGEEVSWGQRIFQWRTPAQIEALNLQGETNLHNLSWVDPVFGLARELLLWFWPLFLAYSRLLLRIPAARPWWRLAPSVKYLPVFLLLTLGAQFPASGMDYEELMEACLGAFFLAYSLDLGLRGVAKPGPTSPRPIPLKTPGEGAGNVGEATSS